MINSDERNLAFFNQSGCMESYRKVDFFQNALYQLFLKMQNLIPMPQDYMEQERNLQ